MSEATIFFTQSYKALRPPRAPMKWMGRMFARLIAGNPPSLIDLPTGAGKTDLIIVWLIALAWYAQNRESAKPVPRRLVWVVNRRVLVQQVDRMAKDLIGVLDGDNEPIARLVSNLRLLCRQPSGTVFSTVQLRGQRLDDREWSLDPTMPQLIIGTVDQIGSRLLFQGYGQGKWSRPMQAALFGVDAWVCIDEAHLVPAFAVTLRQVRDMATSPLSARISQAVTSFFDRLPFWITELSATPGLPSPRHSPVFPLEPEDEADEIIADRLLAKKTRRVLWKPQPDPKAIGRDLADEAFRIARESRGSAIAVFCSKETDAKKVAKSLNAKHKNRVLLVTGRIRGCMVCWQTMKAHHSSASPSALRLTSFSTAVNPPMTVKTQTDLGNESVLVLPSFRLSAPNCISRHSGMFVNGWLIQQSNVRLWLILMAMNGRISSSHPTFGPTRC